MASAPTTKKMMKEATCSICLQLMTEAVSIDCGHSFCRGCMEDTFRKKNPIKSYQEKFTCPLCQKLFQRESLRSNKQLENLIESMKELEHERLCEEHGEQLCLFCKDHGRLICWRCEHSPQHRGHSTELVEEAAPGFRGPVTESENRDRDTPPFRDPAVKREILQIVLTDMREQENQCQSLKLTTKKQIRQWEEKTVHERKKIQFEFDKLYNFLHGEEAWFLWRLEEKKEQTLRSLQDSEASLEKQSQELKSYIRELEEECQQLAQDLLQDMRDTLGRSLAVELKVQEAVSLELQTVCNVSELCLDLKKMLKSYQGL